MAPGEDLLVCATTTRYLKKLENTKNKVETKKRNSEETHFFDNLKIRFFFWRRCPNVCIGCARGRPWWILR